VYIFVFRRLKALGDFIKKVMKVVFTSLGLLFLSTAASLGFFIYKMPSAWQVRQVIATKSASNKALHENFMNEQQPIASVCAYLSEAPASHFLKDDNSASLRQFLKKMIEEPKDPLAESAAPFFRYLFRLSEVRDLVQTLDTANETAEQFRNKAEFYGKIGLAALEVAENKHNFDQILMKTYNLYVLTRAVALKPELARDPAILGFCEQIQKNINMNLAYDVDQQATELQKFLTYAGLSPKEVDYDINYRSDVKFKINDKSIILGNIWIEKLFVGDIEKAKKQINSSLPLPDYNKLDR